MSKIIAIYRFCSRKADNLIHRFTKVYLDI
jgi:hypothetical protein